jgi:predicted phosphodiesterase
MRIALWSDIHWNENNPDSINRIKTFILKLKNEKIDKLIIAGDQIKILDLKDQSVTTIGET